jgi:hypothetical protein
MTNLRFVLLTVALPVLLAACTTATPTPAPPAGVATAAPSPGAGQPPPGTAAGPTVCPADPSVCAFATALDRALVSGDFRTLASRNAPQDFTCPGPQSRGPGDPFPLCTGAAPGERRTGFSVARFASEGEVHSETQYQDYLRRWATSATPAASDAFGTGAIRLYSLGCPAEGPCKDRFSVVFSALRPAGGAAPQREQLVFYAEQPAGGEPRIVWTITGLLFPGQGLEAALRGGTASIAAPRGFPPATAFRPWNPGRGG